MNPMKALIQQLRRHEGFRGSPYLDTKGKRTIGYGRNLDANPFTNAEQKLLGQPRDLDDYPLNTFEAGHLLRHDIERHQIYLHRAHPLVAELDDTRQMALLNMAFNLGVPRLGGFKRMWRAIAERNWELAAAEAWDSKWRRKDVGDNRAADICHMLRLGTWPVEDRICRRQPGRRLVMSTSPLK